MSRSLRAAERSLLKRDGSTIDTERVVFAIWDDREDAAKVCDLVITLSKFVDEKRVFRDIEFYLPQLTHLVIHLEDESLMSAFQQLIISLCQASIHLALQLHFILLAAMEDYQPETQNAEDSTPIFNFASNPTPNPNLTRFFRCNRLLNDLERTVIYGTPALTTTEESRILAHVGEGKLRQLYDEEKEKRAGDLVPKVTATLVPAPAKGSVLYGYLLYKRIERKSMFHSKRWKFRFFSVQDRVLNCYHDDRSTEPMRSVCLPDCFVEILDGSKHEYAFSVTCRLTRTIFLLRAPDANAFQTWLATLQTESERPPGGLSDWLPPDEALDEESGIHLSNVLDSQNVVRASPETYLTAAQRKRFHFFMHQRQFVGELTEICDKLGDVECAQRKHMLNHAIRKLTIPSLAYIPLCSSLDPYRCVKKAVPEKGYAFTATTHSPAFVMFEMEEHPAAVDVATFLQAELHEYENSEIDIPTSSDAEDEGIEGKAAEGVVTPKTTAFSHANDMVRAYQHRTGWRKEGAGITRLSREGEVEAEELGIRYPKLSPTSSKSALLESAKKSISEYKATSPFGMLPGWKLFGFIAKNNTDIRQEAFVMQLIRIFQDFFDEDRVPVRLYPYRIQTTSKTTGLAEYPEYAVSIDAIKQSPNYQGSLLGYFESSFGPQSSETFRAAVTNFVKSMAGYSVVTYLLSIKDRHNGNIMIDNDGYMIHTDCEFAFGYSSNKSASLEKAPFKLTQEIVDVMLGMDSVHYAEYKKLCIQAFISSRKHADKLCKLFEIMSYNSNYTAFKRNPNWISDFRTKLALNMQDTEIWQEIDRLVSKSYNHSGTLSYDRYQRATNGIAY